MDQTNYSLRNQNISVSCTIDGGMISAINWHAINGSVFNVLSSEEPTFPMAAVQNRTKNGQLQFNDDIYQINPLHGDEPNSLHGNARFLTWQHTAQTDNSLSMSVTNQGVPGVPWDYEMTETITIFDSAVEIRSSIKNIGVKAMPFSFGPHPFFATDDCTTLRIDTPSVSAQLYIQECDENMFHKRIVPVEKNGRLDFLHRDVRLMGINGTGSGFQGTASVDNCLSLDGAPLICVLTYPQQSLQVRLSGGNCLANGDIVPNDKMVIYRTEGKNFTVVETVNRGIDHDNQHAQIAMRGRTPLENAFFANQLVLQPGEDAENVVLLTFSAPA